MEIFYDGECPFCRSYVKLLRLRAEVGEVVLVDARSDDPRMELVRLAGLSLEEGMVVRHAGRLWHGADAAHLLATLSGGRGILRWLLADEGRARLVYPWLVTGRRIVLILTRSSSLP
ncbi:thiol-disulfide oxidoreductase DCC family protein [Xanthobacteraceae bacterium A53D]